MNNLDNLIDKLEAEKRRILNLKTPPTSAPISSGLIGEVQADTLVIKDVDNKKDNKLINPEDQKLAREKIRQANNQSVKQLYKLDKPEVKPNVKQPKTDAKVLVLSDYRNRNRK